MTNNSTILSGCQVDSFSGYGIPSAVKHTWSGTTLQDSLPVTVTMEFPLTNLLDKIDVLSELNFLLRRIIQALVTAPFVYQWFEEDVKAVVQIGQREPVQIPGRVFHENTFLSQLP